ncbi:DUF389 domain-containing protein [Candidatus Parcubacteria bacterium]|nr:MAG: DUF389 domain-containing protein [Candidatus Parcubacteria bacterium]
MKNDIKRNRLFDPQQIDHENVIHNIVAESSPRKTFLVMIFISSIIATLGLLNDSSSVVIGAMLVAPLLWPFLGIGMGLLLMDWKMIKMSFKSIFLAIVIAVLTAMFITFFYVPLGASREIIRQTELGFMWMVAVAAGAAAAFAVSYPSIKEAVAGIAISVALLPPLVIIGIGLGGINWVLMEKAIEIFIINLLGIIGVTFVIFWLLGFKRHRRILSSAVKKEEKILNS